MFHVRFSLRSVLFCIFVLLPSWNEAVTKWFGLVGMFWKPGVTPHHSVHDCLGLKTISNIAHFRNWEALERINFTNRLDERKNHRWFQNMFSVHPKFAGKWPFWTPMNLYHRCGFPCGVPVDSGIPTFPNQPKVPTSDAAARAARAQRFGAAFPRGISWLVVEIWQNLYEIPNEKVKIKHLGLIYGL